MLRVSRWVGLAAGVVLLLSGSAGASASCGTDHSGRVFTANFPPFKVVSCSTDTIDAAKYDKFIHFWVKFSVDHSGLIGGYYIMESNNGSGWSACESTPSKGVPYGQAALAGAPIMRDALKAELADIEEMKAVADFPHRRKDRLAIDAALVQLEGATKQFSGVVDLQEAAANALIASNCELSGTQHESAQQLEEALDAPWLAGANGITKALNDLYESSPCKDDVDSSPPMSDGQIDRAAGGGGVQHGGGTQDLSVVAPKRLKVSKHGPVVLPLTLKPATHGAIEIWFTQGKRLILNAHVTSYRRAAFGLRLTLSSAAATSSLQLKIVFSTGATAVKPTRTIKLTIRRT